MYEKKQQSDKNLLSKHEKEMKKVKDQEKKEHLQKKHETELRELIETLLKDKDKGLWSEFTASLKNVFNL